MSEHIRIARVSADLWRIYSDTYDNGEWIDCDAASMRSLLDELLKIASQFDGIRLVIGAEVGELQDEDEDEDEDETPETWQIRTAKSPINCVQKPNEVV